MTVHRINQTHDPYLLDGLIAPKELSVWWGRPKSGKSFLMLRLCYGLAQGRGMWGREAGPDPVPVLYVAGEGEGGIMGRVRALHDRMGTGPHFHLIAAARAHKVQVVTLDTLARVMGAGDENATRDMNVFVRNCDRIREETGAHVAVVHHCWWNGDHSRGSNALIGAADLVMKVAGEAGAPRAATIEYAKESASGDAMGFELDVADLPPDAKGKPRSTCVAIEADATMAAVQVKGRMNEEAITLLREVQNAIACGEGRQASPEPGMPVCSTIGRGVLQAILIRKGWLQLPDKLPGSGSDLGSVPDREHKRLYQRLTNLKMRGIVGFNRVDVWLVKAPSAL